MFEIAKNKKKNCILQTRKYINLTCNTLRGKIKTKVTLLGEEHCSNAVKSFALFLTQVKTVFLGTPYFVATSLLEKPLSRALKALHFSFKFFTLGFRFDRHFVSVV